VTVHQERRFGIDMTVSTSQCITSRDFRETSGGPEIQPNKMETKKPEAFASGWRVKGMRAAYCWTCGYGLWALKLHVGELVTEAPWLYVPPPGHGGRFPPEVKRM